MSDVQNDKTYYFRGSFRADKGNQTDDEELLPFEETVEMCTALREDLDLTTSMLQVNQTAVLKHARAAVYETITTKIKELETQYLKLVRRARKHCRKQLRDAAITVAREHQYYNRYVIDRAGVAREEELEISESKVDKAAKHLRHRQDEEQKLRFTAARLYLLLKKNNLLTGDEGFVVDDEKAKTAEIISQYQSTLQQHDATILWLRARMMELEEMLDEQGVSRPGTTTRASQPAGSRVSLGPASGGDQQSGPRLTPGSRGAVRRISSAVQPLHATSGPGSNLVMDSVAEDEDGANTPEDMVDPDNDSSELLNELDPDLARAEELEQGYEARIAQLVKSNRLEMDALIREKERIAREWEVRLTSLLRLHDEDHVQRVVKRQERLLKLATEVYKPRPPKEAEVQVYLKGLTLRMLQEEEARRQEERARKEEEERKAKANEEALEAAEALQGAGIDLPSQVRSWGGMKRVESVSPLKNHLTRHPNWHVFLNLHRRESSAAPPAGPSVTIIRA
ncbi:hypothetical protein HK104_004953 [Borealophlyctis nickersoniae]|nr:hypothetical protein HK104_004953 [Borealophlyctis nickersoniae]